jgi:PPOX class probable F420-dependent enzyme
MSGANRVQIGAETNRRLREAEVIWLTTVRRDGQPQSVPVGFLWDGESILIYSRPNQQKERNIRDNPRVSLNLDAGEDLRHIVRVEGYAEIDEQAPPATEVPAFVEKYRESYRRTGQSAQSFARAFSVAIRVRPTRVWGD